MILFLFYKQNLVCVCLMSSKLYPAQIYIYICSSKSSDTIFKPVSGGSLRSVPSQETSTKRHVTKSGRNRGSFVNSISILGYLIGQKRAVFAFRISLNNVLPYIMSSLE